MTEWIPAFAGRTEPKTSLVCRALDSDDGYIFSDKKFKLSPICLQGTNLLLI